MNQAGTFKRLNEIGWIDHCSVRPLPSGQRLRTDNLSVLRSQRLQIHHEPAFLQRLFKSADDLLLKQTLLHHLMIEMSNCFTAALPDRAQSHIGPVAHHGDRNGRIFHFIDAEVNAERIQPAAELIPERPGRLKQQFLFIHLFWHEQRKLIPSQPSAQAVGSNGNLLQGSCVPDDDFVAFLRSEQRVDKPEIHDIAGDHHPGKIRIPDDYLPGEL